MRKFEHNKLATDEEQIGALVGTLSRVEAPADFDFRVRARIAKGRSAVSTSWFPATVRVAVPLGLVLSVGGYFAFNSYYVPQENGVPAVAAIQTVDTTPLAVVSPPEEVTPATQPSIARVDPKQSEISNKIEVKGVFSKAVQPKTSIERSVGGSYDEAVRERRTILPRGFNGSGKILAKDVLDLLGITSTFDGTGWKVTSVGVNNIADHSGIQIGDVIEAIDGQKLVEKTSFPSQFNGKSLRVSRDGKSIQIDLKP